MRRVCLWMATAGLVLAMAGPLMAAGKRGNAAAAAPPAGTVADEDVRRSIEKGREWLTNQQQGGVWPEKTYWHSNGAFGHTELATMTLLYTGSHPTNSTVMVNALSGLPSRQIEYVYARAARTMAYAYALKGMKTSSPKRDQVRQALIADAQWLVGQQKPEGNWGYGPAKQRPDFSNTQFAILALWEAAKAGVEIPSAVWQRTLDLYLKEQSADGAWSYGPGTEHPNDYYGSMTAAGLATIYICTDMLNLASGCPCAGGHSGAGSRADVDRRIELALKWLDTNFTAAYNPPQGGPEQGWRMYWLYAVERVGLACGYKYFGNHNWFHEGAAVVLGDQQPDGSWGKEREGEPIVTTCFAILFLYKGRAPILYNKLQKTPGGEDWKWDPHRRDMANLTAFTEKDREEHFQWQIVSLKAPVSELHDAPILYISAETAPKFTDEEKKKLREFTDTGGTVLFEASCGAPAVRDWFKKFAKEVWPEWDVKPLPGEHGTFTDPTNPMKQRPEMFGIDDGLRTCVFYAMDDISCPWQTRAVAGKEYMFKYGFNLFAYATDHGPLRAKLGTRETAKDRYTAAVKPGAKASLSVARLKTDSDWITNRNYKGLDDIAAEVSKRASLTVKFQEDGADATALAGKDAAYLVGSKELKLAAPQQQALKDYLSKGGFLWAEAADGAREFDESFRKLAKDMGLELKIVDKTEPLMTGKFGKAAGYDLTTGVQFRRALRIARLGRPFAEFYGIYMGGKMVGVYSPLDIGFAVTSYEAYNCRGYQPEDAVGVATNILLFVSDR
jgi:hypothetical protein